MNARGLWLGLLALLLALRVAAAPTPGGWQPDAVLSKLMLHTLVTTPEGLIWVGTDDGVYRYDGTELVSLNALRRGGPALPPVPCSQLLPLPDGSLWLGTETGLYRFGPDGVLRALPLPAPGQPSRYIVGVQLAPDGRHVWVYQRDVGLRLYSLQGQPAGPLLRYTAETTDWLAAPDGTQWLVGETRTTQLDTAGRVLREWHFNFPEPLFPVYSPQGQLWLLTRHAAYRLRGQHQLQEVLRWEPQNVGNTSDLLRNTPAGPVLLRPGRLRQFTWTTGPDPQLRLLFALPLPEWWTGVWNGQVHADNAGRWWVFDSSTRGCWFRTAAPAFIQSLPGPDGQPYSVRASVRLPNGRLLVSSYQQGLLTQAADSPLAPLRRWAAAVLPTGNAPVLMGVVPAPLGPGGDWLAAGVYPFLRFNPRAGRFAKLPVTDQSANTAGILSLSYDPAGRLVWGGTRAGLYWYDTGAATYRPFTAPGSTATPLAGRSIEDVCPDGHGRLWLATPEGVERLTLATGARTAYGPAAPAHRRAPLDGARCLYLAPDGRLWVGTRAHGLAVIEPDGRAHPALTLDQGLPNASVASITPSPGGYLWLGTYQGLVRYHPGSGRLAIFTTAHGLASDECNARAAYVDPTDGSLLIGGVAGLHRIWPDRAPAPASIRPRLLLTRLTTFGTDANHTRYLLPPDALPALRLAPDAPLVDLHLALTHDLDPTRARYAYRVRGWLGNRWLGLGTTPQLRLQGLPPGDYTVEIRAETSQGVPATNRLHLPLTVTAAWWNRPLTWVLAGLAAVAAVYLWQRGRLRRLRRENELRARLAADLHDEVGALLTRVTMQAELLRELEAAPAPQLSALVDDSRAAASTVRDIIWSVDARADTLAALVDRVQDHLDATARATGRHLSLDDTALPPTLLQPLPPTVRQHVYLIFKEALTNALKYSQPGTPIAVALGSGAQLELSVSSRGAAASTSRAGQGLRNMRHRAALLRAELEAGGVPGGWRVHLRVPL